MCLLHAIILSTATVMLAKSCNPNNQNRFVSFPEYDTIFNSPNFNDIDEINCVYNCNGMGERIQMSVFDRARGLCSCLNTSIAEDVAVMNGIQVIVVDFNRLGMI